MIVRIRAHLARSRLRRSAALTLRAAWLHCAPPSLPPPEHATNSVSEWPAYGGDLGGARYSSLSVVTRESVGALGHAWTYCHSDVSDGKGEFESTTAF